MIRSKIPIVLLAPSKEDTRVRRISDQDTCIIRGLLINLLTDFIRVTGSPDILLYETEFQGLLSMRIHYDVFLVSFHHSNRNPRVRNTLVFCFVLCLFFGVFGFFLWVVATPGRCHVSHLWFFYLTREPELSFRTASITSCYPVPFYEMSRVLLYTFLFSDDPNKAPTVYRLHLGETVSSAVF